MANEEINDLPIDSTVFNVAPGACGTSQATAQITPTNTTCQQFTSGTAGTFSQLQYTLKGGNINAVSPGVFFYYTQLTGSKGDTVDISQEEYPTPPGNIPIQKGQAILYSSTCTKLGTLKDNSNGTATGQLPSDGTFVIGVKYTPSSLKGQAPPSGGTSIYTFDTSLDGTEAITATINLVPK